MATMLPGGEWIYCAPDGSMVLPYRDPDHFLASIGSKLTKGERGLIRVIKELSILLNVVSHAVQNGRPVYDLDFNGLKTADVKAYYELAKDMLDYYAPEDIRVE